MADVPNSHKDPYWTQLASATEDKVGIPKGLLVSILTRGERSNNDQVSEDGARTPFQIIPQTRKAAIEQYGIDPYLSPENAAEVAGLLLKDSISRNKGDVAAAVGEYVGGTDRKNWGPVTKSYINRVMTGINTPSIAATLRPATGTAQGGTMSTFDRVQAQQQAAAPKTPQIAAIYNAYQSGQMTPEEAADFENDVKSGALMLPRGATLKTDAGSGGAAPAAPGAPAAGGAEIPDAVFNAYRGGQMTTDERRQFEADLQSGAIKLTPAQQKPATTANGIPMPDGVAFKPDVTPADPTLVDKVIGAHEAGLSALTGGTTGMLGMVGGIGKGLINGQSLQDIEKSAAVGANALTYQPRTVSGQQQAQVVGDAMQQLVPLAPLAGEAAMLSRAAEPAAAAAQDLARTAQPVVTDAANAAKAAVTRAPEPVAPTPGTLAGVGATGTDMATQRRQIAAALPEPIELTKGQAERSFEQQRFEQESAKDPTLGAPLRERFADQNEKILKNFDTWVDQTGAEAPNLRAVGQAVDRALVAKAARDKTEIRVAYKEAEKAGEMAAPVPTNNIVTMLNDSASAESVAPVLSAAKKELLRLGGAEQDAAGTLVPKEMTLGNAELLRRFVNKVAGADPTNIKYAADLKGAIDASTEGLGGGLYQRARNLRAQYAQQYENRALINDLLSNKRGTGDRRVALEDVFNRSIMQGSLDDMRTLRKVLQTGGDDGRQAWRELQGQALQHLKEEATKNVARDTRGNPVVSASGLDRAVRNLDRDGKLDYLFGKQGAQQLRDVNDLAKVVYTAPPGAINTSNTASVLLAALDMGMTSVSGVPLPVMSGLRYLTRNIKDRKLARRINESLNDPRRNPDTKAKGEKPPAPNKSKKTLH